jgi:CBS domain-containing protein
MSAQNRNGVETVETATVADVMRRQFISLGPEDTVREAELMMRLARVRSLPVVREGVLLGLVSYHRLVQDWLGRLLRRRGGPDPARRGVDRLMSPACEVLRPDGDLLEAASRVSAAALGFLPVVEQVGGRPRILGVLTESDLLRHAYDDWSGATGPTRPRNP